MTFRGGIIVFALLSVVCGLNNRPIVGVLTQPTDGDMSAYGSSYIAASYVKYLEGGGARVVPVFHNSTQAELDAIFDSINGLLFPGGGADLDNTPLYKAGEYLYNKALTAFDNGDYFPIVGHCMGFELLSMISSKNLNILSPVVAENISMPLEFSSNFQNSRWFRNAPTQVVKILSTEDVTLNNHQWGVTPSDFQNNNNLPKFYNVLSTNQDVKGKTFISTMEGIKYPVYAAQWHAEKVQYEWNPNEAINHSPDAVLAMQYFAEFIVNEARKSEHSFPSYQKEYDALIYNYNPVYSEARTGDFEQLYVF